MAFNLGVFGLAPKKWNQAGKEFFTGSPETRENVSTLRPEQEGLYNQAVNAGMQRGAGGAFGESADYYRDLMGNDSEDYNRFAAPAMRQYSQDISPGISEQFAGMGAGGLSSSGFRNAQTQGGVDLAERLGAMRANLRQSGAQGLQNIGNVGLQNYSQNMVTQQGSPGILAQAAPIVGTAAGMAIGGPAGAAIGNGIGNMAGNWMGGTRNSGNNVGANTGPYGNGQGPQASANIGGGGSNIGPAGFNAPNWKRGY